MLAEIAELAKEIEAEVPARPPGRRCGRLTSSAALVEAYLDELAFAAGARRARGAAALRARGRGQADPAGALPRDAEAAGGRVEDALPAALAIELVHTFSLVHDDLPAMDDDDERRGRPSAHVAFGEGVALLAGDALLAEALRLALSYDRPEPARELADATLGMIGGQYLDITGADVDLEELHRLKTGRLFAAAVGLGLWAAAVPAGEQAPWRAFGEELGLLFQVVDDILDGDGYAHRARRGRRAGRCRGGRRAARTSGSTRSTPTRASWPGSSTSSRSRTA